MKEAFHQSYEQHKIFIKSSSKYSFHDGDNGEIYCIFESVHAGYDSSKSNPADDQNVTGGLQERTRYPDAVRENQSGASSSCERPNRGVDDIGRGSSSSSSSNAAIDGNRRSGGNDSSSNNRGPAAGSDRADAEREESEVQEAQVKSIIELFPTIRDPQELMNTLLDYVGKNQPESYGSGADIFQAQKEYYFARFNGCLFALIPRNGATMQMAQDEFIATHIVDDLYYLHEREDNGVRFCPFLLDECSFRAARRDNRGLPGQVVDEDEDEVVDFDLFG
jgi:hypothetical protein